MKLHDLHESSDPLDRVAEFKVVSWVELGTPPEGWLDEIQRSYTDDPPPAITPINARVLELGEPDEDGIIPAVVRMTVRDFIKNSVEYGEDPYDILNAIKNVTDEQTAAAAHAFISNESSGLRVARIGHDTVADTPTSDNWPASPDL